MAAKTLYLRWKLRLKRFAVFRIGTRLKKLAGRSSSWQRLCNVPLDDQA
jgi:hypothetical protein